MDAQLETGWPAELDGVARSLNPLHAEIFKAQPTEYSWSGYQTEWATDKSQFAAVGRRQRLSGNRLAPRGGVAGFEIIGEDGPRRGEQRRDGLVPSHRHRTRP